MKFCFAFGVHVLFRTCGLLAHRFCSTFASLLVPCFSYLVRSGHPASKSLFSLSYGLLNAACLQSRAQEIISLLPSQDEKDKLILGMHIQPFQHCIRHAFSVPATTTFPLFSQADTILHNCLSDRGPGIQDMFLALRMPHLSGRTLGFHLICVIRLTQHHTVFSCSVVSRIDTGPYCVVVFWGAFWYRVPAEVKDASKQRSKGSDASYNHVHAVLSISPNQDVRDSN
jgi:hypothetical protein